MSTTFSHPYRNEDDRGDVCHSYHKKKHWEQKTSDTSQKSVCQRPLMVVLCGGGSMARVWALCSQMLGPPALW